MSPTSVVDELPEVTVEDWEFRFLGPSTPLTEPYSPIEGINYRLLAFASVKGVGVAGAFNYVSVFQLDDLRRSVQQGCEVPNVNRIYVKEPVQIVEFSSDQEYLVIALLGGQVNIIPTLQLSTLSNLDSATLLMEPRGLGIVDIKRRPLSSDITILYSSGQVINKNLRSLEALDISSEAYAISWSPQGKQLLVGDKFRSLQQYLPSGEPRQIINPIDDIPNHAFISNIIWLKTHTMLVTYSLSAEDDHIADTYLIQRSGAQKDIVTWHKVVEPCPPFGDPNRKETWYADYLQNWSTEYEFVVPLAYGPSSDISLITEKNSIAMSEDSHRAMLPFSNDEETSPMGLVIDVFATEEVDNPVPDIDSCVAQPIMWILNNQGHLIAWWIISRDQVKSGITLEKLQERQKAAVEASLQDSKTSSPAKTSTQKTSLSPSQSQDINLFNTASNLNLQNSSFSKSPSTTVFGGKTTGSGFNWGAGTSNSSSNPVLGSSGFSSFVSNSSATTSSGPAFGASGFSPFASKDNEDSSNITTSSGTPFGASGFSSFASKGNEDSSNITTSSGTPFGASGFSSFASKGNEDSTNTTTLSGPAFGASGFSSFASKSNEDSTNTTTSSGSAFGASGFSSFASKGDGSSLTSFHSANTTASSGPVFGSSGFNSFASKKADNTSTSTSFASFTSQGNPSTPVAFSSGFHSSSEFAKLGTTSLSSVSTDSTASSLPKNNLPQKGQDSIFGFSELTKNSNAINNSSFTITSNFASSRDQQEEKNIADANKDMSGFNMSDLRMKSILQDADIDSSSTPNVTELRESDLPIEPGFLSVDDNDSNISNSNEEDIDSDLEGITQQEHAFRNTENKLTPPISSVVGDSIDNKIAPFSSKAGTKTNIQAEQHALSSSDSRSKDSAEVSKDISLDYNKLASKEKIQETEGSTIESDIPSTFKDMSIKSEVSEFPKSETIGNSEEYKTTNNLLPDILEQPKHSNDSENSKVIKSLDKNKLSDFKESSSFTQESENMAPTGDVNDESEKPTHNDVRENLEKPVPSHITNDSEKYVSSDTTKDSKKADFNDVKELSSSIENSENPVTSDFKEPSSSIEDFEKYVKSDVKEPSSFTNNSVKPTTSDAKESLNLTNDPRNHVPNDGKESLHFTNGSEKPTRNDIKELSSFVTKHKTNGLSSSYISHPPMDTSTTERSSSLLSKNSDDEPVYHGKAPLLDFGSGTSTPIPRSSTAVGLTEVENDSYDKSNFQDFERFDSFSSLADDVSVIDRDSEKSSEWDITESSCKKNDHVDDCYPGISPFIPLSIIENDNNELADFDLFYKQVEALFENIEENISNLHKTIKWNKRSDFDKPYVEEFSNTDKWKLDDATEAPLVRHTLDNLGLRASTIGNQERIGEQQIPELKRLLGVACLKLSRIQEIIRYKEGETSEKVLAQRSLPIRAVELQRKLRSSFLSLEEKMNLVENDINLLKGRLSSMTLQRPTAHTIKNSIYRISVYAQEKLDKVEELGKMMETKLKLEDSNSPRTSSSTREPRVYSPRNESCEQAFIDVDFLVRKSKRDHTLQLGEFLYNRPERDILKNRPLRQPSFN